MSQGTRSMLAFWLGGAADPGLKKGYRSLLAFWVGGAANLGGVTTGRAIIINMI